MRVRQKMRKGIHYIFSKRYFPYWLLLPSMLVIFGVVIYPLIYSFFLSLHRVYLNEPGRTPFVGFGNYSEVFLTPFFGTPLDALFSSVCFR